MNILGTAPPHNYRHDLHHGRSALERQATRLTVFAGSRPGSVLASEYIVLSSRVEPMQEMFLQTVASSPFTPELQEQARKTFGAAQTYLQAQLAPATLRAYTEACGYFAKWCAVRRLESLPATPESIALYISELAQAGKRASTLTKVLAAIRFAHKTRNLYSPTEHPLVTGIMAGIRRVHGSEPVSAKLRST